MLIKRHYLRVIAICLLLAAPMVFTQNCGKPSSSSYLPLAGFTLEAGPLTTLSPTPSGIPDPRKEFYQVSDRKIRRYARADLLKVDEGLLTPTPGGYWLSVAPWQGFMNLGEFYPLCPDEHFYNQPSRLDSMATSILVGEDLVLAARHTLPGQAICETIAFVFDHGLMTANSPLAQTPPDGKVFVDAKKVFFCQEVVASGQGPLTYKEDWIIVRLDRPVIQNERIPMKIIPDTSARIGDSVVIIGHHFRLPMKIEETFVKEISEDDSLRTDGHPGVGNSGSMMVNKSTGYAEGLLKAGGMDYYQIGDCYKLNYAPQTSTAQGVHLKWVAPYVPPIGLEIRGKKNVEHYGPPGGPFTNPENITFQLNVSGQSRATEFKTLFPTEVLEHIKGKLEGVFQPGDREDQEFSFMTSAIHSLPAGSYDYTVNFEDETYLTNDIFTHKFNVGLYGFDVLPEDGFDGEGHIGALINETKNYSIANKYAVRQKILVKSDVPWILLDGRSEISLDIAAGGQAEVTVSFDPSKVSQYGFYDGIVTFSTIQPGVDFSIKRKVRLDYGRKIISAPNLPIIITPSNDKILIEVSKQVTIADLDLGLKMEVEEGNVTVQLTSPQGASISLLTINSGLAGSVDTIFDDDTHPPRIGLLSIFNGQSIVGIWEITFASTPPNQNFRVFVDKAALRVRPTQEP